MKARQSSCSSVALCSWAAVVLLLWTALAGNGAQSNELSFKVGVAAVDVTPDYPVRLSGYASRKSDSEGVAQRIFVKALALSKAGENPAVLVTADTCGVPAALRDELVKRLSKAGVDSDHLTVCSTHTHSAPWLNGYLPNLFLVPLTAEEQARRDRYTREFTAALEQVALKALADQRPATISSGKGRAAFAANRRTESGPVDQDLPALVFRGASGELRAVLASYACHCTTLTGEFNQICGDWAGYAQEYIQEAHPGAVAIITIGGGGDANPKPRPGWDLARLHGREIATEINRVLTNATRAITGPIKCATTRVSLPFDTLPTLEEWQTRAKDTGYVGSHARLNLARLERGEEIPAALPYLVQTWTWGKDLAMVFLPGEVVVDYSLRLKSEFDHSRLWIVAYANDVPCYIPSERVLKEGGYEGGGAMVYYDRPTRFASGIENIIVGAVHKLIPADFTGSKVQ